MNVTVLLKTVPDTVEELEIAPDGRRLDPDVLRFKLSDSDEHAVEQALLLKERYGGKVTVVALDSPEVDDALYTALAKGADRAVKLEGDVIQAQSFAAARLFCAFLRPEGQALPPDTLVLLRSQAVDDLEGEVGPIVADVLGLPYVCVVTGIKAEGTALSVVKEFAGGLRAEFGLTLPAVLGIQSAEKPPRYVPIAKVRATMKSARIETMAFDVPEPSGRLAVVRMYKPEPAGRATMLEGSPEEVADKMVAVLSQQGLV